MTDIVERERSAGDISQAERTEFLQLIRQGLNRQEAAFAIECKPRLFRALCSPQSPFYDEEFARAYGEAIGSLEHEQHRLERLRAEAQRRALVDSDRLLEKLLMVYDPDWAVLRQKEVNVSIDVVVQRVFKNLPTDKLEQILAWMDEQDVVDADALELEAGGEDDPG